jgi:hypothetical protein
MEDPFASNWRSCSESPVIDCLNNESLRGRLWLTRRSVKEAKMDKVVDPRALPAIDRLGQECIEGPFDLRRRQLTEQPLEQYFLTTKHPSDIEP